MVPRENKNNALAKFGGTNKKYYGIFPSGLLLWFCIASLSDWFKVLAPLFQQIRNETKANGGTFSRALCGLRVITLSFDWFTGLSPSFLDWPK